MKITKSQLRQIIKEELESEVSSDDVHDRNLKNFNSFLMIESSLRSLLNSATEDDQADIAKIISELKSLRKSVIGL